MRQIVSFFKKHLDSWDEICINDSARLRLNLILFSFVIFLVFLVMSIRTAIIHGFNDAISSVLFGLFSFFLFLWQLFRRKYSIFIACVFGLMSLTLAVFLIISGGVQSTGHIWLCILPIVGTMMVPLRYTIAYNGVLFIVLTTLLTGPFSDHVPDGYSPYLRVMLPISILILTLCNYVAEYTRNRTQKQLIIMTERLRDFAFTDPLTGAYNRRALTSHFGELEEPAYGLSFAMLDLDFFKSVNDTYGHEIGDKLLCHLVYLIKKLIPPGAQLYRWGGEEFLLILKSSDYDTLVSILDSIRQAVADTPLTLPVGYAAPDTHVSATVSIGGSIASGDDNIESSINQADGQMYIAKSTGRNKVVVKQQAAASAS